MLSILLHIHVCWLFCDWLERLLWGRLFAMKRLHPQSSGWRDCSCLFFCLVCLSFFPAYATYISYARGLFVLKEATKCQPNLKLLWSDFIPRLFPVFNTLRQTYRNIISNWCIIFLRLLVLYFIKFTIQPLFYGKYGRQFMLTAIHLCFITWCIVRRLSGSVFSNASINSLATHIQTPKTPLNIYL